MLNLTITHPNTNINTPLTELQKSTPPSIYPPQPLREIQHAVPLNPPLIRPVHRERLLDPYALGRKKRIDRSKLGQDREPQADHTRHKVRLVNGAERQAPVEELEEYVG